MRRGYKGLVLLATAVSTTVWPAASFAADWQDLVRTYLDGRSGSSINTNQGSLKQGVNARQAQLEADVDAGVASGQLTTTEETALRADLNRIAAMEGGFLADGNFSNVEAQSIIDELTLANRRLHSYLTNAESTAGTGAYRHDWWNRRPVGGGASGDFPPNQRRLQATIDTRQAELDASLEDALTTGRLDWTQARAFRTDLGRIHNLEATFLADGKLTYGEEQQLNTDMQALNTRITAAIAATPNRRHHRGRRYNYNSAGGSINARQNFLSQRIAQGYASHQLTAQERARLLANANRINSLEAQLRVSGNRMSYSEQQKLHDELDRLERSVNRELSDRQVR